MTKDEIIEKLNKLLQEITKDNETFKKEQGLEYSFETYPAKLGIVTGMVKFILEEVKDD